MTVFDLDADKSNYYSIGTGLQLPVDLEMKEFIHLVCVFFQDKGSL